jgi:hypothetical protein
MEVIAANFSDEAAAAEAADEITNVLHIDPDLVSLEHLGAAAELHAGEPVLVAWVDADDRAAAREVVERHAGRHVPLDWLQAVQEDVAADTFGDEPGGEAATGADPDPE